MQSLHLQGLNGIRAIAALAVLLSHITNALGYFGLNPHVFGTASDGTPQGLSLAGFGVSIFFSLSGFLITYLLLLEKEKAGISIKKFYIRRALRIWPLYYLYLIVSIGICFSVNMDTDAGTVALYTLYAANVPYIIGTSIPFLAHYWSLGVEEQFYLFWPWLVKKTNKKLLYATCGLIVALVSLKLFARFLTPGADQSLLYRIIHITRFHCMLIGGAGAMLYYAGNKVFLQVTTNRLSQVFAWGIIGLIVINKFHVASVLDNEFVSLVTIILIVSQVNARKRIINLERNVFDFLGKISYGMYVIHPLIIFSTSQLIGKVQFSGLLSYLFIYSLIIALTILVAYLSYEYFEKWFLRLKNRYAVIKTSATKDYEKGLIPGPVKIYTDHGSAKSA